MQLIDGDGLRAMLGPEAVPPGEAAPDRADEFVRSLSGPRPERPPVRVRSLGARGSGGGTGLWLALSAVGLVVFALLMWGVMKKTAGTAGPSPRADVDAEVQGPRATLTPVRVRPGTREGNASDGGCTGVVAHGAGVYGDGCTDAAPPPPTRAALREQQRRADEAARVIEASTPEM